MLTKLTTNGQIASNIHIATAILANQEICRVFIKLFSWYNIAFTFFNILLDNQNQNQTKFKEK